MGGNGRGVREENREVLTTDWKGVCGGFTGGSGLASAVRFGRTARAFPLPVTTSRAPLPSAPWRPGQRSPRGWQEGAERAEPKPRSPEGGPLLLLPRQR